MTDLDIADLARSLAKTVTGLERFIAAEAQKRANKLAVQYAKAADERVKQNAADMQRLQDLVAELRRQMKPLLCTSAAYHTLDTHLKDLVHNARQCGTDVPVEAVLDAVTGAQAAGRAEYERQKAHAADA